MRTRLKVLATVLALSLSAVAFMALISSLVSFQPSPAFVAVQAAAPLVLLLCILSVICSVLSRRHSTKVVSFAVLALWSAFILDINLAARPTPTSPPTLKVAAANLLLSNITPSSAIKDLLDLQADVLVTVETLPGVDSALLSAGFDLAASGSGRASHVHIWSRLPAAAGPPLTLNDRILPVARITSAAGPITVVGVHLMSPTTEETFSAWRSNWAALSPALTGLTGRVLVMGDFNTSMLHPQLRSLLGRYDSASSASWRSYLAPTWPALPYKWWTQPLQVLDLDHILLHGLGSSGFSRHAISGSDHLSVSTLVHP